MSADDAGQSPDHVVFVVHGVGDPQPADALTSLVDSYCALANAEQLGPTVRWAAQDRFGHAARDPFVRSFPIHQADTRLIVDGAEQRTRFVEVYWGDLSRVKGTLGGLLMGTIDLVFGLRHIAGAAHFEIRELFKDKPALKTLAQFASWLGWAAQALMRAPMLALNVFAAIVAVLFMMDAATRLPLSPAEVAAEIAAAAAGAEHWPSSEGPCAGYLSGAVGAVTERSRPTPEAVYCRSGGSGIFTAGVVCIVLGIVLLLFAAARGWSSSMATCLTLAGAASLGMVWAWGPEGLTYAAFVEGVTSVLSMGAALMGFLVVAMLAGSLVAWLAALKAAPERALALRRALTVVNVCTTLSTALFVLLLMIAWAALSRQIDIPVIARRIESSLHLFVVVWLTFVFIGGAYGAISLSAWWRKRHYRRNETQFPRFIIGGPVVAMVLLSAVVWPLVFVPTVFGLECNDSQRLWSALWVCDGLGWQLSEVSVPILNIVHQVDNFASVAVMASIGAVIVLVAARTQFGTALDIVLDVQSHFSLTFAPGARITDLWKRLVDTEGEGATRQDAIWQIIVGRFCVVVQQVLERDLPQRVSVLAHSQGTMIALEALNAISIARKGDYPLNTPHLALGTKTAHLRFDLVTMGCPLHQLYKHYFQRKYDIVRPEDSWLRSWINVYRADDFVGRAIEGPKRAYPRNVEIAPRGHVNYWADRAVIRRIIGLARLARSRAGAGESRPTNLRGAPCKARSTP